MEALVEEWGWGVGVGSGMWRHKFHFGALSQAMLAVISCSLSGMVNIHSFSSAGIGLDAGEQMYRLRNDSTETSVTWLQTRLHLSVLN